MGNESDGTDDEDLMQWSEDATGTKRQLSREEIDGIIGNSPEKPTKKLASERYKNNTSKQETDKQLSSSSKNNTSKKDATNSDTRKTTSFKSPTTNNSLKMKEIINKKFKHLFYINTDKISTRLQMADTWKTIQGNPNDIILQTRKGFLLKSNTDKKVLLNRLENLKVGKKITNFEETSVKERQTKDNPLIPSYSAVIATVEQEITDEELSNYLNKIEVEHRFCKRIVSKKTGKNTYLIRIITGCIRSFERLLNEGLFYKNRHYPVYTSLPPPPAPLPCGRCFGFDHKTGECNTPLKCHKCQGNHHTNKCTTQLTIKCTACSSEEHAAWSFKCPKRPTNAIPNIPNIQIKSINKKTEEISSDLKKENRIHSPITKHDFIINTYLEEINNPNSLNREETILKIRKKFVELWRIDTTAVFTQNRLYILMFDLDSKQDSPTEPLSSPNSLQWRV